MILSGKKWRLILLALFVGIAVGSLTTYLVLLPIFERNAALWERIGLEREARVRFQAAVVIDGGSLNGLAEYQTENQSFLSNYVFEVERLRSSKARPEWMRRDPVLYWPIRNYLYGPLVLGEAESEFLWTKAVPLAQEFVARNNLALSFEIKTNSVEKYRIVFYGDRPGGRAKLTLTNGYVFSLFSDGSNVEVWHFSDRKIRTSVNLDGAPKDKAEAVKALNLKNKLNDTKAVEVATRHFTIQGHSQENFHPIQCRQLSWGEKGDLDYVPLPYYIARWYRKDVKPEDVEAGVVTLPSVTMEISGINSNLISYSKVFMPVGSDF